MLQWNIPILMGVDPIQLLERSLNSLIIMKMKIICFCINQMSIHLRDHGLTMALHHDHQNSDQGNIFSKNDIRFPES